ncbi:MAG: hypothetical protein QY314_02280 [Candidatus Dojkabacteria bacterium]|nr:MAG: hypothetical protein QY314_02280 [Candidatus Dojkabacteria bacterium]
MKYLGFLFNILNGSFSVMGFFKQVMIERNMISHANKITSVNITAMKVWLAWAAGNIVLGGVLIFFSSGILLAFAELMVIWNIVSAVLAFLGLQVAKSTAVKLLANLSPLSLIRYLHSLEKLFVFGAGLDIAYSILGVYLIEKGTTIESTMWAGFGAAVIVQAMFLLGLDSVLYFLNRKASRQVFAELEEPEN